MTNSLLTGFSGLASHQKMIEVVGHNLANLNTTGFKSGRASFSDVYYDTVRGGSGGLSGVHGGINPAQVGTGSKLASVSTNFSQGGHEATGAEFDFALDGQGFFVVNSENGPFYTRAGSFGVDQSGYLVDISTGYHVQRFGTVGEVFDLGPSFQTVGSGNIRIPIGASVPGQATSAVDLRGNLSPTNLIETTQELTTRLPFATGGVAALPSSLLNDLDLTTSPYSVGDVVELTGTNHDGSNVFASISVNETTTVQQLLDDINSNISGSTARLGDDGNIAITADTDGLSFLHLTLNDAHENSGGADYVGHSFETTTTGVQGDVVRAGIEIYDEQGAPHIVGVELRQQPDLTWTLDASLDPIEGTLIDGQIDGITFNPNGSFQSASGRGTGDNRLVIQFAGSTGPQAVKLNFGEPGTLTGVTSIATSSSLSAEANGASTGTLVTTRIDSDGVLEGVASNGRRFPLAQVAVAMFRNPHGLETRGDNMLQATTSSGPVELGAARSGGRGIMLTGQLEQSNVDIAIEFTRLIIAQRGFSANARTITVSDEILEELTNILR